MASEATQDLGENQPTAELVSGAVGGRCANCAAVMASDQRYCLNCGERRGKARFPVASPAFAPAAPVPAQAAGRGPRGSSAATLVAGVATLLIAMGVGVLIGHDSAPRAQNASAPIRVELGGGGANTTASSTTPSQTQASTASAKVKHTKIVVVHLTPKLLNKASGAASKVFGQSGNLSHNATQQVGGSCSGGAGCQNGKFTGNFFGP